MKIEYNKNKNWLKFKEKQRAQFNKNKDLKNNVKLAEKDYEKNKRYFESNLNNFNYIDDKKKDYIRHNQTVG